MNNTECNDPKNFNHLPIKEQTKLLEWIKANIKPRKTVNDLHSSYGLKHIYERNTNIYVDNGTFKGAMQQAGFKPHNANDLNWIFCLSKKSPAFKLPLM